MRYLPFDLFRNIATQRVVTVGADGFLRQFGADPANMRQQWLRRPQQNPDDGTFKIISRASNRVIDAQGGALSDYTALQQYVDTGNPNQRWRLVGTDPDPQNVFLIKAADTEEAWTVFDTADGAGIVLDRLDAGAGRDTQKWRIERTEDVDAVEMKSLASFLVLDVPGFSQVDGGFIQQYKPNGGFNQLWQRVRVPDGGTEKIRSVCSGRFLDYPLQSALDRRPAQLGQYAGNPGDNQKWRIIVVDHRGGQEVVNIASAVNGFFLDVPDGLTDEGVHIQAYPDNGGADNQRWLLV